MQHIRFFLGWIKIREYESSGSGSAPLLVNKHLLPGIPDADGNNLCAWGQPILRRTRIILVSTGMSNMKYGSYGTHINSINQKAGWTARSRPFWLEPEPEPFFGPAPTPTPTLL